MVSGGEDGWCQWWCHCQLSSSRYQQWNKGQYNDVIEGYYRAIQMISGDDKIK